jgi:hypothetical protein
MVPIGAFFKKGKCNFSGGLPESDSGFFLVPPPPGPENGPEQQFFAKQIQQQT